NPTSRLGVLLGLRLNRIDDTRDDGSDESDDDEPGSSTTRLSGSLGVNLSLWKDPEADLDDVVVYASYGNTFQPPQIDFGPDAEGCLLQPATERSYEAGIKADGFDGGFSADLAAFWVDFDHQAVATLVDNTPGLASGGRERFKGVELEVKVRPL